VPHRALVALWTGGDWELYLLARFEFFGRVMACIIASDKTLFQRMRLTGSRARASGLTSP
jgi:hypothetical protein